MSDFVKPVRVSVQDEEYIENLIKANLVKDLNENEEICQYCHGTGLVIADNPYGLSDDPDKRIRFPYAHRSLTFCPHCFNGIVHRCSECGELIENGYSVHRCTAVIEKEQKRRKQKEKEYLENLMMATDEEIEKSGMFYSDYYNDNDGYFDDWDEFFDYWHEYCEDEENENIEKPEFVYATYPIEFSIDADSIVENYTADLYEDAAYDISDSKMKELQKFLNDWCKNCGVSTTYASLRYAVDRCIERPHFKVCIVTHDSDHAYEYIKRYAINKYPDHFFRFSRYEIMVDESIICFVPMNDNSRGNCAHLLIVDEDVDDDILQSVLLRLERQTMVDRAMKKLNEGMR